jgi:fibronectin type 3 domain-containing protein
MSKRVIVGLVVACALLGLGFYFYPAKRQQPVEPPRPHRVTLNWEKVPRAVSYNIYRRPYRSDTYTKLGTAATNSYEDATVVSAAEYCYQITSVDAKGHESARSKDLCVTVPHP